MVTHPFRTVVVSDQGKAALDTWLHRLADSIRHARSRRALGRAKHHQTQDGRAVSFVGVFVAGIWVFSAAELMHGTHIPDSIRRDVRISDGSGVKR